jgi:hypothetical protein
MKRRTTRLLILLGVVVVLASVLTCGCVTSRFPLHAGPPRVEISSSGVVRVGTARTVVRADQVSQYLHNQKVSQGSTVGLVRSAGADRAIVDQVWKAVLDAGCEQGLTVVK